MAFVNSFSWYQPNLLVKNINKKITIDKIYKTFSSLNYGSIDKIELSDEGKSNSAVVVYNYWFPNKTKATRILLDSGKSLSIYYDEDKFWKVSAVSEYPKNSLSKFIKEVQIKIIQVQPPCIENLSIADNTDNKYGIYEDDDDNNYKDVDTSKPEDRPVAVNYGVVTIPKRYRKPAKNTKQSKK